MSIIDDDNLKPLSNESDEEKWWSLSVESQNKSWLIRRSYDNFRMLDQQLHRCIYDRKFSELTELPADCIEDQVILPTDIYPFHATIKKCNWNK